MRVGVERLRNVGMAKTLADCDDGDACGEEMACMAVAQRMDCYLGQAGSSGSYVVAAVNRALRKRNGSAEEKRGVWRERVGERRELIAQLRGDRERAVAGFVLRGCDGVSAGLRFICQRFFDAQRCILSVKIGGRKRERLALAAAAAV